jgi:hypothetical protein
MNNAPTADGRGTEETNKAEPFFPSEGTFHPVVPLSEIGRETRPTPLSPSKAAAVGKPAEAASAREAHLAALKEEEETTLVPTRRSGARRARRSWFVPAVVIGLSVLAGLASGTYLISSKQRAAETQPPAQVTAEAPSLPPASAPTPAPVAEEVVSEAKVEKVKEAAAEDKSGEDKSGEDKSGEVVKAEQPREVARPAAAGSSPQPRPAPPTRAERTARAAVEAREVAPAPRPASRANAPPPRARVTAAAKRPPAPPARTLPVSDPPPSTKSRKVIQWP